MRRYGIAIKTTGTRWKASEQIKGRQVGSRRDGASEDVYLVHRKEEAAVCR